MEQFGYAKVQGDSLIIYGKDGDEVLREALVDVHKIAVEDKTPTTIKTPSFPITGRKVLEPDGQVVILQGEKKYRL